MGVVASAGLFLWSTAGCQSPQTARSFSVDDALRSSAGSGGGSERPTTVRPHSPSSEDDDVLARVDGTPITWSYVIDLLIEGHGVSLLEQIIVLAKAERLAAQRGLKITQGDVEAEYALALENLLGDVASDDSPELRRRAGEAVLAEVLASRNVSRREFMIVTRRNAILRKILGAEMGFDDAQLREEFDRLYGHIIAGGIQ